MPAHADEDKRLKALHDLRILDTPPEAHFDALCRAAQALFLVPIATITMVDADRQWQKARCGPVSESAPREITFCTHTIQSDDLLVVEDATQDVRFTANPFVAGQPSIRFYAGAPLILRPGIRIGTVCLIDTIPRRFDAEQRQQLQDLATVVLAHLRLYEAEHDARQQAASYQHVLDTAQDAFISIDSAGVITRWNAAADTMFGWSEQEALGCSLAELIVPARHRVAHATGLRRYLQTGESAVVGKRRLDLKALRRDGTEFPVEMAMSAHRSATSDLSFSAFLRDVSERKQWEASLLGSEARYRLLAENATDMIVRADLDGTRRYVSPACRAILGYEDAELIGTKPIDFIHPYDASAVGELLGQIAEGTLTTAVCAVRHRHKDSHWVWVETSINVTLDPLTGKPDGYVGCVRDITQRKALEEDKRQSEERLRTSEERLALALESGTDGVWDWCTSPEELWFSASLLSMLGYGVDEIAVSVETWVSLIHPDDRASATRQFYALLKGLTPLFECEHRLRKRDGSYGWVLARGRVVSRDDAGRALRVIGTHIDITARKGSEERLAHLACHDGLTDLPNRLLFRERLDHALANLLEDGGSCALLYLDLDRFKTVNDTLGHLAGDTLLKEVARRFQNIVSNGDTLARLGGDEFAILQLAGAHQPTGADELAQRLIETLADPILIQGQRVDVGLSVGIALASLNGNDADTLIKRADLALYRAKGDGRNARRFYEAAMDKVVEEKRRLEMDLRGALTRGEFEVHYQPIMEAVSGSVSSVEALVRWRHPAHGLVSPAAFIPLAEETGLIVPIGEWVLQMACCAASTWPSDVRVAVNVSAMQFRNVGLVQTVMQALAASGLRAHRLELEITESVLMQDGPDVLETLHHLRTLGVRTALDDFGTGYSSLSYLRRFPFDKLKIDRSFVQDIDNPSTAAIVQAIVDLGVGLGMTITAEGIETEDQLASLKKQGCNEIQGYYYSRPLHANDVLRFIVYNPSRAAA
nr:EAL domain-containing protein [Methylobacterium sp. L1A1]